MFTTGVVFTVLAGLQVLILLLRDVAILLAKLLLKVTDRPSLKNDLVDSRVRVEENLTKLKEQSPTPPMVFALVFTAAAIFFFYFQ